jgi:hypothetical protein
MAVPFRAAEDPTVLAQYGTFALTATLRCSAERLYGHYLADSEHYILRARRRSKACRCGQRERPPSRACHGMVAHTVRYGRLRCADGHRVRGTLASISALSTLVPLFPPAASSSLAVSTLVPLFLPPPAQACR